MNSKVFELIIESMFHLKSSRRNFFKASIYLSPLFVPGLSKALSSRPVLPKFKVYGIGSGPSVLNFRTPKKGHKKGESVFFGFNNLKQFTDFGIPIKSGHSVERLKDGELITVPGRGQDDSLVVIDEASNNVLRKIRILKGFGTSGHLYNDTKNNKIFVPIEKLYPDKNAYGGQGQLMVFNYSNNRVERYIDLKEFAPHQVGVLPKKGHIVVSFYGKQVLNSPNNIYKYKYPSSKIVILDQNTLKIIKEFKVPGEGYLSHFCVDDNDNIYMPIINYANNNSTGLKEVKQRLNTSKNHLSLTPHEIKENKISLPEPVIVLDTNSFKYKEIKSTLKHQRGPQSIYYHKRTKEVFISYFVSDQLMNINTLTGKVRYKAAFDFGIENIRGISGDSANKEIYVSGHQYGLATIDDSSLKSKSKIKGYTYGAAHLFNAREKV